TTPPTTALSTLSLHDALPISSLREIVLRQPQLTRARLQLDAAQRPLVLPPLADDEAEDVGVEAKAALEIVDGKAGLKHSQPQRRSEEHTSELQSRFDLVCRLL